MADSFPIPDLDITRDQNLRATRPAASLHRLRPEILQPVDERRPSTPAPLPGLVPPRPTAADVPAPPADDPFDNLPNPTAGDRIKAEDFRTFSLSLRLIHNAYVVSSALCGRTFSEAKLVLASQQYTLDRAISVFGTEPAHAGDTSLDERKVLLVIPTAPGQRRVVVVLTEAVDNRRFMPNLVNKSYGAAAAELRTVIGDAAFAGLPMTMPQLVGHTVADARAILDRR